jgi:alkylation response protein AidB-like acyl-CoA dehydrogenase
LKQHDDWSGFGQRMTGSGTAELSDVHIDRSDVFWYSDENPSYIIAFYQLVLLATLAGIGRAVVRDAVEYVQGRTRVFSHGSGATAREDPLVQHTIGHLSALSFAADATVLAAVNQLERINDLRRVGTAPRTAFDDADIAASLAQGTVARLVLEAATELFEVGGSSALAESRTLDRHWRNARTVSTHNPTAYKVRAVGDHLLNDQAPTYSWVVGTPAPPQNPDASP